MNKISKDMIPIESKEGVTIYGRIIGKGGKMGCYEVYSHMLGSNGVVYHLYKDAQIRMAALIGIQQS